MSDDRQSRAAVKVAIAGLGRSGWQLHARMLKQLPEQYRVVAVTDTEVDRRIEAASAFGCDAFEDVSSMIRGADAELFVIATPNHLHTEQSVEALAAGKHVVCEKPLALTTQACDRMIAAARASNRILTAFQNMRYFPDYQKVREILDSGLLGQVIEIRIHMHRFSRRWDWQTLHEYGGGDLNNGVAHLLDLAMEFYPDAEPQVWADIRRTLSCGDAEDHVHLMLRAADHPTLDIEVSNCCAYPLDNWHVLATHGGLHGDSRELRWRWVDFRQLPARSVEQHPTSNRSYNRERMPWQEDAWTAPPPEDAVDVRNFYTDLYRCICLGAAPVITPESVRRRIAIIDQCRQTMSQQTKTGQPAVSIVTKSVPHVVGSDVNRPSQKRVQQLRARMHTGAELQGG